MGIVVLRWVGRVEVLDRTDVIVVIAVHLAEPLFDVSVA
jgi:hypothetical protein